MEKFIVSNSPFIHSKNDVNKMFLYVAIALVVPAIYGTMLFELWSLLLLTLSLATCFLFECLYNLIHTKKFMVDNFSFFVTGMILALTLPIKTPLYVVILAAFFSEFIAKMAFGGLGRNKFNPALAGRCFAGFVCSGLASNLSSVTIAGDEYVSLALGGSNSITNLVLGQGVGGIGTTCTLIIMLCFVFLVSTSVVDFKIPILAILSYFVVSLIFYNVETTMMNMLSGSFIFVSVFMITDPNTSPNSFVGKVIYSCLFGALSALVWKVGLLGENSIFAVALVVNLISPMLDKYIVVKPLSAGGYRNAYKN